MDTEPPSIFWLAIYEFSYALNFSIVLFIVLLLFSAIASGSEIAIFSLTKKDFEENRDKRSILIQRILKLLKNKSKLLSTILIFNNTVNIAIVLLGAYIFSYFELGQFTVNVFNTSWNLDLRLILDLVIITFVILLFGEIIPKIYAKVNPLKFLSFTIPVIETAQQIFSPISYPLNKLSGIIESKFEKGPSISINHLEQALELAAEDKSTTKEEKKILEGIINFGNTVTREVMTPRIDMFAVPKDDDFPTLVSKIKENGYSRIPVYGKDLDDIVGVIYAKDFIKYLNQDNYKWNHLIRKPYFVPENKKLDDLLADFQEKKNHMAVVVDEYGGVSGVITLEDIIEEIVGDISDEFDEDDISYSKINENTYIFEGKTPLKDFFRVTNIDDEEFEEIKGEAETLAGLILELATDFPKKNQVIDYKNISFVIEREDKRRIKQVKVIIN